MFMKKNTSRIFFLVWIMVIIFISSTACAQGPVPVPNNTVAILAVDKNGKITALDLQGNVIKKCKLKGQSGSEKLCKSLDGPATVGRGDFVMTFKQKKNPCYIPIFLGGYQIEIEVACQ
jgi:hypothetical protein